MRCPTPAPTVSSISGSDKFFRYLPTPTRGGAPCAVPHCPLSLALSAFQTPHTIILSNTNKFLDLTIMSKTHPTTASTSTSNFQLMINNALNKYKERTKKDLREHPLAAQLQSCDSPSAIIIVLQQQVQGLDPSRSADERWTKWLDPTVNVLYAFSGILGSGFSLVCLITCTQLRSARSYFCASYSPLRASYLLGSASCFQCVSFITLGGSL